MVKGETIFKKGRSKGRQLNDENDADVQDALSFRFEPIKETRVKERLKEVDDLTVDTRISK